MVTHRTFQTQALMLALSVTHVCVTHTSMLEIWPSHHSSDFPPNPVCIPLPRYNANNMIFLVQPTSPCASVTQTRVYQLLLQRQRGHILYGRSECNHHQHASISLSPTFQQRWTIYTVYAQLHETHAFGFRVDSNFAIWFFGRVSAW